jgi:hypothetical protein
MRARRDDERDSPRGGSRFSFGTVAATVTAAAAETAAATETATETEAATETAAATETEAATVTEAATETATAAAAQRGSQSARSFALSQTPVSSTCSLFSPNTADSRYSIRVRSKRISGTTGPVPRMTVRGSR